MNAALWTAHLEAVELRNRIRDLERQLRRSQPVRRCVYCGTPTRSRQRACHAHTDLPRLDPGYHA